MSLDYFLLSKDGYNIILQDLDSIIGVYLNLNDVTRLACTTIHPTYIKLFKQSNDISHFIKLKHQIYELIAMCDENISILNDVTNK
jgi:hypothetical protein